MQEKYIIEENNRVFKRPMQPKQEDYYDIEETEEERKERIFLYSEVK